MRVGGVLRQHRRVGGEDERRLAVGLVVEDDADAVLADFLHPFDGFHAAAEWRAALVAQQFEGEHHVFGRYRLPVRPSRLQLILNWMKLRQIVPFH